MPPPSLRSAPLISESTLELIFDGAMGLYLFSLPWQHTAALKTILCGVAIVCWLLQGWLYRRPLFSKTPLDLWQALVTATVIFAVVASSKPSYSLTVFKSEQLWQLVIFYLLAFNVRDARRTRFLAAMLFLSIAVVSLYGIYGYMTEAQVKVDGIIGARATSMFSSFGRAAFFVSLALPLIASCFFHETRKTRLWLLGFLFGISVIFLILTFARGAWLSICLTLLVIVFLKDRRIIVVLALVLLFAPLFMPENVLQRGVTLLQMGHFRTFALSGDRYWVWCSAAKMIKDHPWLGLGYGHKIFMQAYPHYMVSGAVGETIENAHNFYLQITVERGIIGAIALILLLGRAVGFGVGTIGKIADQQLKGIMLGCLASFMVFFTYGMTTYRYEGETAILVWFIIAFIIIIGRSTATGSEHVREK